MGTFAEGLASGFEGLLFADEGRRVHIDVGINVGTEADEAIISSESQTYFPAHNGDTVVDLLKDGMPTSCGFDDATLAEVLAIGSE